MTVRSDFAALVADIKGRIRAAQTRAVLAVNAELVRLYWDIGRIIHERQERAGWGAGVIPRLARELHNELPELKGFSERNIKLMLAFYREYPNPAQFVQQAVAQLPAKPILPQPAAKLPRKPISPQAVAKLPSDAKVPQAAAELSPRAIVQQPVAQLPDSLLWSVPWAHHVILIQKVKDLPTRRWYMEQTLVNGWSRNMLAMQIDARAHARHGKAVTNFAVSLPAGNMNRIPIRTPSLVEQRAIACILGALDDKIELNRRKNRTPEGLAQALFQSWFVDFDPVRANAAGQTAPGLAPHIAKLFPDAFEDSELGEIPQGWKVGTFGDIAEERRRSVNADDIPENTPYIALEHMPRRSITLDQWAVADSVASGKLRFNRGEILFGKLRPYFHKVGLAPIDGVCSTDIVVLGPRSPEFAGVVLEHSASDAFVAHTDRTSVGTKMPRTNWRDMAQYALAVPPAKIAARFSDAVAPLIERIQSCCSQSRVLTALRDTLLPKLISGELRVPDAERIAGIYL